MKEYIYTGHKQIKNTESFNDVLLHEDILDILFKHKEEVYKKLIDLRGTFLIDHIAIKIIDSSNKIVIFSLTPSVEYNLIVQGLWKYDQSFSAVFQKNKLFYSWDEAYFVEHYDDIKRIKEFKHGFSYGFCIPKQVDTFKLIYSYATRSKNGNLNEYYLNHINELTVLGDYGYKLLQSIYIKYCSQNFKTVPITSKRNNLIKPDLKLIVDNT